MFQLLLMLVYAEMVIPLDSMFTGGYVRICTYVAIYSHIKINVCMAK